MTSVNFPDMASYVTGAKQANDRISKAADIAVAVSTGTIPLNEITEYANDIKSDKQREFVVGSATFLATLLGIKKGVMPRLHSLIPENYLAYTFKDIANLIPENNFTSNRIVKGIKDLLSNEKLSPEALQENKISKLLGIKAPIDVVDYAPIVPAAIAGAIGANNVADGIDVDVDNARIERQSSQAAPVYYDYGNEPAQQAKVRYLGMA